MNNDWERIRKALEQNNKKAFVIGQMLHNKAQHYNTLKAFYAEAMENLSIQRSTIYNYLNLYRNLAPYSGRIETILKYIPQSILYELLSPKVPQDAQALLLENIDAPLPLSKAKALHLIKRLATGELTVQSLEIQQLIRTNEQELEIHQLQHNILKPMEKALDDAEQALEPLTNTRHKRLTNATISRMRMVLQRQMDLIQHHQTRNHEEQNREGLKVVNQSRP